MGRARRVLRATVRLTGALVVAAVVGGGVGAVVLAYLYYQHVVAEPGPHVERAHIRTIIAQETPVYYRDAETRVGVFFDAEHREYVAFEGLPESWVMAIVAAEDQRYFSHPGIDVFGIARAMSHNIAAGRVVAGGSTLTQQTAKNLYYRPDRSLKSKGTELVNALRLEALYSKGELLGFYANQFHVSGNGRGLGIGARHFFNKDVEELSVVESAFLAGLVKAPGRYDPFLGDEARRARAEASATERTRYVLGRMSEVDLKQMVPPDKHGDAEAMGRAAAIQAEAREALKSGFDLDFKRGTFRYDASAVLDEVARRLTEAPFPEVLAAHGVTDPATAGLQVITTLDPVAQRAATYGLWHHLTEVGIQLEQRGVADLILDERAPRFDPDRPPEVREFRRAVVAAEREVAGKRTLEVDLGGHACHVDRDALVRIAGAVKKGRVESRSARPGTADVDAVVEGLPVGSVVYVSVRAVNEDSAVCDLEVTPELQGSVVAIQGGEILAMVAGNDNRNFNRATALRQMGSTWKPLVFHAAMQLGWSPEDALDNRRAVFPFSTTFYYPRPDHEPRETVSMSWAGVNSENLASIWLLYHLTDKLDGEQVRVLASTLDLARREGESEKEYRTRIQKAGVLPTYGRLSESLFLQARHGLLAGADQLDHPEDTLALQSLLYGWGFDPERRRVASESPANRAWKQRALANDYRTLEAMMGPCVRQYRVLKRALKRDQPPTEEVKDLWVFLDGSDIHVGCGVMPEGYVRPDEDFLLTVKLAEAGVFEDIGTRRGPLARPKSPPPMLVPEDDILMDDRLHLSTLRALRESVQRRETAMSLRQERPDLYSPELLYWHSDFRVLLALRYLQSLAEQYGVQTELPPVLSLPLGAAEITLEEATSVYGGLVSGSAWDHPGETPDGEAAPPETPALLISEIRDVDGNVLYRARPEAREVGAPGTGVLTAHILRNTVDHGTGGRARALTVAGRRLPVGGKTGTTNEFRNAAFLGFVPVWQDDVYNAAEGIALGVYVGYDDNRPLTRGGIRLAGSSGALPAWVGTIQGLVQGDLLGTPEGGDEPEASEVWPLQWPSGLRLVEVSPQTGLPLDEPGGLESGEPAVLIPEGMEPEVDDYQPRPRPPRLFPRTEEWAELPEGQRPRNPLIRPRREAEP